MKYYRSSSKLKQNLGSWETPCWLSNIRLGHVHRCNSTIQSQCCFVLFCLVILFLGHTQHVLLFSTRFSILANAMPTVTVTMFPTTITLNQWDYDTQRLSNLCGAQNCVLLPRDWNRQSFGLTSLNAVAELRYRIACHSTASFLGRSKGAAPNIVKYCCITV